MKPAPLPATVGDLVDVHSGHMTIIKMLVDELSKSGSIDRKRFIDALKKAYNEADDPDGPKTQQMHALARVLEHGPKKPKPGTRNSG
jgi:hypothetical protein